LLRLERLLMLLPRLHCRRLLATTTSRGVHGLHNCQQQRRDGISCCTCTPIELRLIVHIGVVELLQLVQPPEQERVCCQ
jgi:hypothetical protein